MNFPHPTTPLPLRPRLLNELSIISLFFAATFVTYFFTAPFSFLYEDDYFTVGVPATQGLSWIWDQICLVWHTWPQGRPAMFCALALEGGVISATGSVLAGYIPSFLTVAANAYLVYRLFLPKFSPAAALAGALFCLLSCADPHKILLTHAPLQFAVTLNLLGLILYQRDRPILAYLVAGSSLFFYEISFAIFSSAELFRQLNTKTEFKRLGLAWGAWFGVAVTVLLTRLLLGETRAVEATANLHELIQRILTNVFYGPLYGLDNSYLHPFIQAFKHPNYWLLLISVCSVLCLSVASLALFRPGHSETVSETTINPLVASAMLLMLIFGPYALQLKRTVFDGFMRPVSGYHLGMGVALGFAATLLVTFGRKHRPYSWAIAALLMVLCCGSIYQNLLIQCDYARSARYQAHFWAETRRLSLDATPGDVILVPRRQLLESEYLLSNSWGVTYGWMVLFEQTGPLKDWMNTASTRPVTVFFVPDDWEKHIVLEPDGYYLPTTDYTPAGFRFGMIPLQNNQIIVLEATWAEPFQRRAKPIMIGSHEILLKSTPEAGPKPLKQTVVGAYLFNHFIN